MEKNARMDVIVVGGGIAGSTMALSLNQAGVDVRVYEAVREMAPLGVGINLQPTAVRELVELGIGNELANACNETQILSYFNKLGQHIYTEKRGIEAGYNWPQYSIHRGKLQTLLLGSVRDRIGFQGVKAGKRFISFEQSEKKVFATFLDTETGTTFVDSADILIGADGIHSAVRRCIHPSEGEPKFAGQVLWRAAVETDAFLGGHTMIIAGHFHQRVIVYPIGRADAPNLLMTNWICQTTVPDASLVREDWNRTVAKEKVLKSFGTWRFPWLNVPGLIQRTPEIFEFPLVDRDPVGTWTSGRVTLIGDAAHPMHPIGSQAGTQAIIDARILTQLLASTLNPLDALQHYDLQRRPAMNDIILRNRRFGPEIVMQLVEERAPNGFHRIEDVISNEELETTTKSYSIAAGLDIETVNCRSPFVKQIAG
jgi:2-polyprenyl-6-methoxyphenol hydroxylase-like FAD-dependent oxidoreductase